MEPASSNTEPLLAPALPLETAEAARFRGWLSLVLRGGVLGAGALCCLGVILSATAGPLPMTFGAEGLVDGLWPRLAAGDPTALVGLGVIILALVPVTRVVFSLFHFLRERDTVYVVLTAGVLALLGVGVVMGQTL